MPHNTGADSEPKTVEGGLLAIADRVLIPAA